MGLVNGVFEACERIAVHINVCRAANRPGRPVSQETIVEDDTAAPLTRSQISATATICAAFSAVMTAKLGPRDPKK